MIPILFILTLGTSKVHGADLAPLGSCESFIEVAMSQGVEAHQLLAWAEGNRGSDLSSIHLLLASTFIQSVELNREIWLTALRRAVNQQKQQSETRASVSEEAAFPSRKWRFERFEPRNTDGGSVSTNKRNLPPFELMNAPVTRWLWFQVLGKGPENDAHFEADDLPATQFTQEEMNDFIRAFNEGLEKGNPWNAAIRGHEDLYFYSLPHESEMRWLADLIFAASPEDQPLERLFEEHEGDDIRPDQPVGASPPLVIGDAKLYDFVGYVTTPVLHSFNPNAPGLGNRYSFWGGNQHSRWSEFRYSFYRKENGEIFGPSLQVPEVFRLNDNLRNFSPHPFGGLRLSRWKKFEK